MLARRDHLNISARLSAARRSVVLLAAAIAAGVATLALAAPEPAPVPRSWELRFLPGELRVTTLEVPGVGFRSFYYMPYEVQNNTGEDRYFAPRFELVTDAGEVLRSGRDVPREAVEHIKDLLGNPLLMDEIRVQGVLLQGEENAREAVVIWPLREMDVDQVSVFAAGFSGENTIVLRPDNGETVVLRKTKMLRHEIPGRINPNTNRPLPRNDTASRWIMR